MSVLLSAHKIAQHFASRTLFENLTFSIYKGDRIGLIGPNGAGKSSLMKILAKIAKPDAGDLSYAGGLKVGYLEQSPQFDGSFSIFDTILNSTPDSHDAYWIQKTYEVLSQLEILNGEVSTETLVGELSGGWKKRVALAQVLLKEPDLLLLDEPTNHLDLEGIFWLENFLQDQKSLSVVVVTHDRVFLQNTCNHIFDLDPRNPNLLLTIKGTYSDYLLAKEDLMKAQQRWEATTANTLRRETEWLRRGAKARQTKQTARIERHEDLEQQLKGLKEKNRARVFDISFQDLTKTPKKLLEAKSISKGFRGQTLFHDLTWVFGPKSRIGIVGRNGSGKTTLIRCLLQQEPVDSGEVLAHDKLKVAYYEQTRGALDQKKTVLKNICPDGDYVVYKGQNIFARSYLQQFLFRYEQMDMPLEKLSGGEQSRLLIAKLLLQPSNILVLDEPTNDLDIESLEVLRKAIDEFDGCVLLITHDRFFMNETCNHIFSFTAPDLVLESEEQGEIQHFADYTQWEEWFFERKDFISRWQKNKNKIATSSSANSDSGGKKRKLSFKEKRELEQMESIIAEKETALANIEQEVQSGKFFGSNLVEKTSELANLQKQIETLYARWQELEKSDPT